MVPKKSRKVTGCVVTATELGMACEDKSKVYCILLLHQILNR